MYRQRKLLSLSPMFLTSGLARGGTPGGSRTPARQGAGDAQGRVGASRRKKKVFG